MHGDVTIDSQKQHGQNRSRLSDEIVERLKQPMDLSRVKTRRAPGGGLVPYISGEDAINTANRIFNFDWSSSVGEIKFVPTEERSGPQQDSQTQQREPAADRRPTGIYFVIVSVATCGITKTDVGRCICIGNSAEAHDMALAGAVTDGLKRALRQFGDQFGNVLYDKDSAVFKEALHGRQAAWQKSGAAAPSVNRPAAPAKNVKPVVKAQAAQTVTRLPAA